MFKISHFFIVLAMTWQTVSASNIFVDERLNQPPQYQHVIYEGDVPENWLYNP